MTDSLHPLTETVARTLAQIEYDLIGAEPPAPDAEPWESWRNEAAALLASPLIQQVAAQARHEARQELFAALTTGIYYDGDMDRVIKARFRETENSPYTVGGSDPLACTCASQSILSDGPAIDCPIHGKPVDPLAVLKAEWQAEALRDAAKNIRATGSEMASLRKWLRARAVGVSGGFLIP